MRSAISARSRSGRMLFVSGWGSASYSVGSRSGPPVKTSPSRTSSVSSIASSEWRHEQRPAAGCLYLRHVRERGERRRHVPDTPCRILCVRCDPDDRPHPLRIVTDRSRARTRCLRRRRRLDDGHRDDDDVRHRHDGHRHHAGDDEAPRLLPARRQGAARCPRGAEDAGRRPGGARRARGRDDCLRGRAGDDVGRLVRHLRRHDRERRRHARRKRPGVPHGPRAARLHTDAVSDHQARRDRRPAPHARWTSRTRRRPSSSSRRSRSRRSRTRSTPPAPPTRSRRTSSTRSSTRPARSSTRTS